MYQQWQNCFSEGGYARTLLQQPKHSQHILNLVQIQSIDDNNDKDVDAKKHILAKLVHSQLCRYDNSVCLIHIFHVRRIAEHYFVLISSIKQLAVTGSHLFQFSRF